MKKQNYFWKLYLALPKKDRKELIREEFWYWMMKHLPKIYWWCNKYLPFDTLPF